MIVGYTGPRSGLTPPQRLALGEVLATLSGTMHNGAALGADRAAAELWGRGPWHREIEFFPCHAEQQRWAVLFARSHARVTVHPIRPPLVRNRENLVDPCDLLVATPAGPETPRGGTWSTIRYARRPEVGKPVVLVWPDGRVEWERCSLETGWCESCSTWLIDSGGPCTCPGEQGRVWQCTECWHEEPGAPEADAQGRFVL